MTNTTVLITDMAILVGIFLLGIAGQDLSQERPERRLETVEQGSEIRDQGSENALTADQ